MHSTKNIFKELPDKEHMDILLTDDEVRVLGCLMEKEMATPDYYPLSLNALTNACNQKSNRSPVVSFDEETVIYAFNGLREQNLARQSNVSRVPKYEQIFTQERNLLRREEAVICILLVRGPQTLGEIRNRTGRLYTFQDLNEVQETVENLEESGLLKKLARQPGRKESRYTHLLSGEPEETADATLPQSDSSPVIIRKGANEAVKELQEQVESLRQELQDLKDEFSSFRSQFD